VDDGSVPSCQYALAYDGEVVVQETLGSAPHDARYSIWSSTKPVFASVVWQLMGEGNLDPDAPVSALWPEFAARGKDAVTLAHLLLHTAGFPSAAIALDALDDRDERARQMEQWRLEYEPGARFEYHGFSVHYVMAELVARVTGTDHRAALRERVLDPLGLTRLELGGPGLAQRGLPQMCVPTGDPATAEEIAAALGLPAAPAGLLVLIESAVAGSAAGTGVDLAPYQNQEALAAGVPGAGAVSDAASLALFYQALLHDRQGLWDPAVLKDVTTHVRNRMPGGPLNTLAMRTLGLEVQGDDATARFRSGSGVASPATFGHGGAYGQVAFADPVSGLSFVYLTNGADRNVVRQARRVREVTAAAVACGS
jgi:CubicO group peptidase (beta-lactamase class C family)